MFAKKPDPLQEKELLFATQNKNKVIEIQSALKGKYRIKSLYDVGFTSDLDEPFDTFEANAKIKAKQGYDIFGLPCFSEDAGLVIESLNGAPGVLSARYAGPEKSHQANLDKVLLELKGITNRSAYFLALIAYYDGAEYQLFEGRIYGAILQIPKGSQGFGYDPIFQPIGYEQSFAAIGLEVKNKISHRAIALHQFISFLKNK